MMRRAAMTTTTTVTATATATATATIISVEVSMKTVVVGTLGKKFIGEVTVEHRRYVAPCEKWQRKGDTVYHH